MVAIIAKAVRTVVRVARTIAVTTIVVTTGRPNNSQPVQHQNNRGNASAPRPHAQGGAGANGGNAASNAIPRPHAQGPRPGNNPFSRKQGMHTPTPGDIPRPHPMARPTADNGRGGRPGRPGQGQGRAAASVAVVRAKVVRAVRVPASGATTVRVRAAAPRVPVRAAHAAASVGAKAAAITSRVAVHRATVPHVAAVAAVAAVPQAHSDVRAASPQRPVRTVWQSAMSMRS